MRLLFETQATAQEIAFMLRCEYDGCNMITLPPVHDTLALKTAIELTGADFCFEGDHHPLVLPITDEHLELLSNEYQIEQTNHKRELWSDISPF